MRKKTVAAIDSIRDAIHEQVKDMPPDQYKEFLEELLTDTEASLGSLKEEQEDA